MPSAIADDVLCGFIDDPCVSLLEGFAGSARACTFNDNAQRKESIELHSVLHSLKDTPNVKIVKEGKDY